ncbi:MAG: pilus assembly protein PilM [candidate division Zixibacteria bacterium]|nr:pilus assembly protein PilM [candidate division Zixibacteria bacterium]
MSIGTLFKRKADNVESDPTAGIEPIAVTVTETQISPWRNWYFGKCLAFHLETDSIQMAACHHSANSRRIIELRKVYIPSELTEATARQNFIGQAIDEFLTDHGKGKPRIAVVLGASDTAFRTFHMPILRKTELDSAIKLETEKQIPFPIDESIVDYRRVSKIAAGGRTRYRIALQASTKNRIESSLAPFHTRGIKIHQVYNSHDVIGQLLEYLPDFDSDASYVLLNVGQQHTEIAFYRGTSLEFIHVSKIGTSMAGKGTDLQFEYLGETLASEIRTSLDYYSGQYRTPAFSKIYIYGDLTYCKEIVAPLKTRLGYEFLHFPTERFRSSGRDAFSDYDTAAVCLSSLSAAMCNVRLANLLPPEDKAQHARQRQDYWGRLSLGLITFLLAVGWWIVREDLNTIRDAALDATRQVESFRGSDAYHHYNILKGQIASTRTYLSEAQRDPSYLALSLKELSLLTPEGIYLDQFKFEHKDQNENLTITGRAISNTIPPEIMVAEYLEALNASPFYSEVTIKRHQKTSTGDGFQIEFSFGLRGII